MKKVIFQISQDLAHRLDQVRKRFGLSRSEMIETILLRDCLARQNRATAGRGCNALLTGWESERSMNGITRWS